MAPRVWTELYIFCRLAWSGPGRTVVAFFQVLSQLSSVLHVTYPAPVRKTFIDNTRWLALDVSSVFRPQCMGFHLDFYTVWLLRCLGLPAIGLAMALLWWVYCRYSRNYSSARAREALENNCSFVLFLIYPAVTRLSINMFNCRALGPDETVLFVHPETDCNTPQHTLFKALAGILIAVVTIAIPLSELSRAGWGWIKQPRGNAGAEAARARMLGTRLVASEFDVAEARAVDVVLTAGREHAREWRGERRFRAGYLYYEAVDMARKASLVGLVSCFPTGGVEQIFVACCLSMGWLLVVLHTKPCAASAHHALQHHRVVERVYSHAPHTRTSNFSRRASRRYRCFEDNALKVCTEVRGSPLCGLD